MAVAAMTGGAEVLVVAAGSGAREAGVRVVEGLHGISEGESVVRE